jgi:hypothetical protein
MTIGRKLLTCFGALAAVLLVVAIMAITSIRGLGHEFDVSVNNTARKIQTFGEVKADILQLRLAFRGIMYFTAIHEESKLADRSGPSRRKLPRHRRKYGLGVSLGVFQSRASSL